MAPEIQQIVLNLKVSFLRRAKKSFLKTYTFTVVQLYFGPGWLFGLSEATEQKQQTV